MRTPWRGLACGWVLLVAGCSGTTPTLRGVPEQGIAAVLIGGRFLAPSGETLSGELSLNLEGEGGRRAEVYRLAVRPGQNLLYQIEPGLYRLGPTRSLLGRPQAQLEVRIEGGLYRIPFPRDILRTPALDVKPKKIVPIGIVEVRLEPPLPGRPPSVKVRLDDSAQTRRRIVQDVIREMMDPAAPAKTRESAVAWSRALQNSLLELLSEDERPPLYKAAP